MATISVSLPSDGSTADVSDYNTPITTIVNEFNGNIDNANVKSGAAIDGAKLADDSVTPAKWANPYKFCAYRNAAFNITNAFAKVVFDTELFDTNNNFATGTYTVPVTGYYQFSWVIAVPISGSTDNVAAIYKNGTIFAWGDENKDGGTSGSIIMSLTAGDTIDIYVVGTATVAAGVGGSPLKTYFSGSLISKT